MHTGLAVVTGTEDQHVYVALIRGTDTNTAYVFTLPAKLADPAPDWQPDPARPPSPLGPGTRWASWPMSCSGTASSCRPLRPGGRPWPTRSANGTWPAPATCPA